jgi:hypothetical protein
MPCFNAGALCGCGAVSKRGRAGSVEAASAGRPGRLEGLGGRPERGHHGVLFLDFGVKLLGDGIAVVFCTPRRHGSAGVSIPRPQFREWRRSRIKSCRPRSTSRLGRATKFSPGFLRAASESGPVGRWAALLRSEAGPAPARSPTPWGTHQGGIRGPLGGPIRGVVGGPILGERRDAQRTHRARALPRLLTARNEPLRRGREQDVTRLTRKSTVSGRRQHPAERQRSRVRLVRCGSGRNQAGSAMRPGWRVGG